MKRSLFLTIAGVLACFYGIGMIFMPDRLLSSMTNTSGAVEAALVMRWMGSVLIAVGLINILARRDPGSRALRAILLGNIALHVIGYTLDLSDFRTGFIRTSGLVMGSIVHILLIFGFLVYLRGSGPPKTVPQSTG